jgi:hypothetical protein
MGIRNGPCRSVSSLLLTKASRCFGNSGSECGKLSVTEVSRCRSLATQEDFGKPWGATTQNVQGYTNYSQRVDITKARVSNQTPDPVRTTSPQQSAQRVGPLVHVDLSSVSHAAI